MMRKFFLKLVLLPCFILLLNVGFSSNIFEAPIIDINTYTDRTGTQQVYASIPDEIETESIYIPVVLNIDSYSKIILPSLKYFAKTLENGQNEIIRGVYIQDVIALRVIQQPDGDPYFIDNAPDAVTQFDIATQFGTIGLLAHNDRAGMFFFNVRKHHNAMIIYGDGSIKSFQVTDTKQFQALDPYDPYGNFVDLTTGKEFSSTDLFRLIYSGNEHLILQTCIEKHGILTWGRYFVRAEPSSQFK